jgi:hypothetical protein
LKISQGYREKNAGIYLQKAISLVDKQIEWAEKQILAEQNASSCPFNRETRTTLKWTGNRVEAVELIYALHEAGCLNGGKATLKEIFDTFCTLFDMDIRNFSRCFTGIKDRMKGDRTAFMDKLKRALAAKPEESDRKPSGK